MGVRRRHVPGGFSPGHQPRCGIFAPPVPWPDRGRPPL